MKKLPHSFFLVVLLLTIFSVQVRAMAPPRAVVADPARDPKHPAANQQMLILSGGVGMNALLLRASGSGPKPTLLLLHGLPGNEQNLDLAQAVRRAGWNVLTLHYRGSWGSPGSFNIAGAVKDAEAAMGFLRQTENVAKYSIDTHSLFIAGHSMGGFAAARYAVAHTDVAGLVLIDAWNAGADGKDLLAHPDARALAIAQIGEDLGNSLSGTNAADLVDEVLAHVTEWDLRTMAAELAKPPVLLIGAIHGNGEQSKKLAVAIRAQHGGNLTSIMIDTDHCFADHRIALLAMVVDWLQRVAGREIHSTTKRN